MGEVKRFHFDSVCGDTGLIDEEAELKWWITNVCSVTDLKDNWISACDKLNDLASENERLKQKITELEESLGFCRDLLDGTCNSTRMKQLYKIIQEMVPNDD